MQVELIGVPFDGFGRPGHQSGAAAALREAGLARLVAGAGGRDGGDLVLPEPDPARGPTSLVNEPALLVVAEQLGGRVADAVAAQRLPVVVGGDCSALLGIVPALQGDLGPTGLVFVDGHEDTTPLDVSEDGEAANAEIGLLLGITGRTLTGPLARRRSALTRDDLAVLGPRDHAWRARFGVGTLRDHGVWFRGVDEVAADPSATGRGAAEHVRRRTDRWWLHVDLDVLDPEVLTAQGVPGVEDEPGGLDVRQLTDVLRAAADVGGCVGFSAVIYDPDQDPDGTDAALVVQLVADVLPHLTG